MHRRAALIAVLSTGFAAACADMSMQHIQTKETILEDTLKNYAATIRWGDMLQAQAFVDPAYRQAHPMSDLDMQRYRQVQVTAYNDQPAAADQRDRGGADRRDRARQRQYAGCSQHCRSPDLEIRREAEALVVDDRVAGHHAASVSAVAPWRCPGACLCQLCPAPR